MATRLSRRQVLRLALLSGCGGVLAACAGNAARPAVPAPATATPAAQPAPPPAPPPTGTAAAGVAQVQPTATQAPTTAPSATATPQAAAAGTDYGAAPAPPSPTAESAQAAAPAATSGALADAMASAAARFLDSLGGHALDQATYAFDDAERLRWHWTTARGFPRNGLPLREMTAGQRALALELLRASVSDAGYRKALDIISLQRDLDSDPELYYVTVFGTPGGAAPWGWRFEGHHLSRQFTVAGQRVAMTPFFLGSWPTQTDAGLRAMPREEDAARELVRSLTGEARERAVFRQSTLTDHVTQNRPYVSPLDPVGIPFGDLGAEQQRLALEIVETYLGVLHQSVAAPSLARVRDAGLDQLRFGWAGSLEPRRPHYYRLQGPTFLLEFDNSRNGGTHIHSVWRDFAGDFGQGLG